MPSSNTVKPSSAADPLFTIVATVRRVRFDLRIGQHGNVDDLHIGAQLRGQAFGIVQLKLWLEFGLHVVGFGALGEAGGCVKQVG